MFIGLVCLDTVTTTPFLLTHPSRVQVTFWSWEDSGPLYKWLDSQVWVTPSGNLERTLGTTGFSEL